MPTEKKPFVIESKLTAFIPIAADGKKTAKFTLAGSKAIIELDDSITLNVDKEKLNIDFGKSLSGVLTFDDAGKLFSYELTAAPKQSTAPRSGSSERFFEQR
jgi:hypothetical protein